MNWNCSTFMDDFGNEVINPAAQWRRAYYSIVGELFGDE